MYFDHAASDTKFTFTKLQPNTRKKLFFRRIYQLTDERRKKRIQLNISQQQT